MNRTCGKGNAIEDFTDTISLNLTEEQFARGRKEGFHYKRVLPAAADGKGVKLALLNRVNAQVGSMVLPVKQAD